MAELKIWKRYYYSRARGGWLDDFLITPDTKTQFGIIVTKTDEEDELLRKYPAFKQHAIWPVDPKDIPAVINSNKELKSPAEKQKSTILLDMFNDEETSKIANLSKDSLATIKENVLQIVEKEFPPSPVKTEADKLNKEAKEKFEKENWVGDKPDPKNAGVGKLPDEEKEEFRSFQHLIKLYKKPKEFNAYVKNNQLEEVWKVFKAKKDIKGFVAKLEEENND